MKFDELTAKINMIYENNEPPANYLLDPDLQIWFWYKRVLGDFESSLSLKEELEGIIQLVRERDLEAVSDNLAYDWDYAANLFNNNRANVGPIKKLLEERESMLGEAYYSETKLIKDFLTDKVVGEEFYKTEPDIFKELVYHLCYQNIYAFETLLKRQPGLLSKFEDVNHLERLNDKFSIHYYHEGSGNKSLVQLRIDMSKRILLQKKDLNHKINGLDRVINYGLFDLRRNNVGKVPIWNDLGTEEKTALMNSNPPPVSGQREFDISIKAIEPKPDEEEFEEILRYAAENITDPNNSNHYDVETKIKLFRAKIKNPTGGFKTLIESIIDDVSEQDREGLKDRIENADYRTQNNWIDSFYKTLIAKGYKHLALQYGYQPPEDKK